MFSSLWHQRAEKIFRRLRNNLANEDRLDIEMYINRVHYTQSPHNCSAKRVYNLCTSPPENEKFLSVGNENVQETRIVKKIFLFAYVKKYLFVLPNCLFCFMSRLNNIRVVINVKDVEFKLVVLSDRHLIVIDGMKNKNHVKYVVNFETVLWRRFSI